MKTQRYILVAGLAASILGGGASLALAYANIGAEVRSAHPQMTQRLIVQISPSGQALVRGIVSSTSTNSLVVKSWGGNWNINVLANTKVAPVALSQFSVGDFVGVSGTINQQSTFTIDATVVRDWTVMQKPNNKPVINSISGPTSLIVNQAGTWTINASDALNGNLSYSINWGDQINYPMPLREDAKTGTSYAQTTTFNHAYASPGTYTITFWLKNSLGNVATSSMSVNVTSGTQGFQPMINGISPSYGPIYTQVFITGSGFTPTGNRIKFGNLDSEIDPRYNIGSSDGKTLTFMVPSTRYFACLYTNPACSVAAMITPPGNYAVSVINANGVSNQVIFTVTSYQAINQ